MTIERITNLPDTDDEEQPPTTIEAQLKPASEMTSEEAQDLAERIRREKKERYATILDRGVVHDRLKVDLPPDLYGEWVRDDPLEINRMRTLGFEVDHEYAAKRAIHSDGTSGAKVGDVVFMITSKENKELIEEVRSEQLRRANSRPRNREDEEFVEGVRGATGGVIPAFSESSSRPISAREAVEAAMRKGKSQTAVQR